MQAILLPREKYQLWDEFVDKSPQGFVWDYSWWLDILTDSDFEICVVMDEENRIVCGIALPHFKSGHIGQFVLTQSLGILFQDMTLNGTRLQKQLTNQKEYTKMLFDFFDDKIKSFCMQFHYNYNYWSPLYWRGYQQTTKYTYVIDYSKYDFAEEFSHFSKGHKWILNKVEKKSDLRVVEVDGVDEYLVESGKTYDRQGLSRPYSSQLIMRIHDELKSRGYGKIFKIIDSKNRVHAIEYYIYNKKEAYYWLGASDSEFRESGGHTYLTWYAIQYFAKYSQTFNFGGSMLEAVEKNFKNFSAVPKPYYLITKYSKMDKLKQMFVDTVKTKCK